MNIYCYPDQQTSLGTKFSYKDVNSGPIRRFFKELEKRNMQLWILTKKTLEKAEKMNSLEIFEESSYVGKLKGIKNIYEFRIPPRKRGGVVRIYFGYKEDEKQTIVLLSAEIKTGSAADSEKVQQAKDRYKKVCI